MKIDQIVSLLNATVLLDPGVGEFDFKHACGADLMILLTGLINPHVVRTADMMDIKCIVFVRGKVPPQEVLDVAQEAGIALLCTKETMFTACGRLYVNGLTGSAAQS